MIAPTLFAVTFSTVSPVPQLTRAEFEHGPDSAHVLAFDSNDDVAAEIVLWRVDRRHIRLDAVFNGDSIVTIDNEDPEAVAARLAAVNDLLAAASEPQASWLECAAYAAITAWELSHANPVGLATGILAACECLPEIVDEFEGMECF